VPVLSDARIRFRRSAQCACAVSLSAPRLWQQRGSLASRRRGSSAACSAMRGQVCEAATRSRWCARRRARWRRAACATRAARLGCCWLTRATLARRSTPRPWRGRSLACRSIHTPSTPSARTYVPCTGAHSTGLAHVGVAQARGAAGAARAVRARGRAARLLRVALPERPARLGATACLGAGALLALLLSPFHSSSWS